MRPITGMAALLLALLALLGVGCRGDSKTVGGQAEAVSSRALEQLRNVARDTAWDKSLPMEKRVEAFEALRRSFETGTPEEVIIRYFDPESRSRLREGYDGFVLLIVGPDGKERWLTIIHGKLSNDPKHDRG